MHSIQGSVTELDYETAAYLASGCFTSILESYKVFEDVLHSLKIFVDAIAGPCIAHRLAQHTHTSTNSCKPLSKVSCLFLLPF